MATESFSLPPHPERCQSDGPDQDKSTTGHTEPNVWHEFDAFFYLFFLTTSPETLFVSEMP